MARLKALIQIVGLSAPAKKGRRAVARLDRRGQLAHLFYQVTRMSLEVPPAAGT
jgi:hypothetical protein